MNKLFVSGFPLEISELELAQLIAPHTFSVLIHRYLDHERYGYFALQLHDYFSLSVPSYTASLSSLIWPLSTCN